MNSLYIILLLIGSFTSISGQIPDLNNKDDLKALGIGRITEDDNSYISKIRLYEVNEYWIVYVKDESLHEINMDDIISIEFKESKWGAIKITFPKNKPVISRLN